MTMQHWRSLKSPKQTDCQRIDLEEVNRIVRAKRRRQAIEVGCFFSVLVILIVTFLTLGMLLLAGENHG